jgi:hypothetical protein
LRVPLSRHDPASLNSCALCVAIRQMPHYDKRKRSADGSDGRRVT